MSALWREMGLLRERDRFSRAGYIVEGERE